MITITTNINATVTVTAAVVNAPVIACVRGVALKLHHRLEHWLVSEGSYRDSKRRVRKQDFSRRDQQPGFIRDCCSMLIPMCQPGNGLSGRLAPTGSGMSS